MTKHDNIKRSYNNQLTTQNPYQYNAKIDEILIKKKATLTYLPI